jgi:hypothetical protein
MIAWGGTSSRIWYAVLAAAAAIDVPVEPQSWQADYKAKGISTMFVDLVDARRLAD